MIMIFISSSIFYLIRFQDSKTSSNSNSGVIVLDTNYILKSQGSISAAVNSSSSSSKTKNVPISIAAAAATSANNNSASTQIQNAIQAITGGNPAIQGLQSAYLSAIQQVSSF